MTAETIDPRPEPHVEPEPFTPPNRDPRWAALAAPFAEDEIEWKPQPLGKNLDKGPCNQGSRDRNGRWCGGWHELPAIHLAYVGHAGITTRLNEVVSPENWSWEPRYREIDPGLFRAAIESRDREIVRMLLDNAPPLYSDGGLWINLMILGVTFPGFGDAQGKGGPNAVKEMIGDAIRNGGLRFGIGTYLWGKSARARALQAASGVDDRQAGPVRPADDVGVHGERSSASRPAPPAPSGESPPDGETAAQRAIRAKREQEAARYGQRANGNGQRREPEPPPRPPRNDGDPETAALVEAIVRASNAEQIARLWGQSASVRPQGRSSDVRDYLEHAVDDAAAAARILAPIFAGIKVEPRVAIPVGALVVAAGKHLEAESMSLHDHIAAETADLDPATGRAVTPPADAVPAGR